MHKFIFQTERASENYQSQLGDFRANNELK